jgi:hypothetical protein
MKNFVLCHFFFQMKYLKIRWKKSRKSAAARSLVKFDNRNELKSDFYFRSAFLKQRRNWKKDFVEVTSVLVSLFEA